MKTTNLKTIALVAQLASVIEARKANEKAEKDLKDQVKELLGDELILEAGDNCVVVESRNRRDLDKDAISHDMGSEFIQKYTKLSSYEILTVKSAKRAVSNG